MKDRQRAFRPNGERSSPATRAHSKRRAHAPLQKYAPLDHASAARGEQAGWGRGCHPADNRGLESVSSAGLVRCTTVANGQHEPSIVQKRPITGFLHLQSHVAADRITSCTWFARRAASDVGSGGDTMAGPLLGVRRANSIGGCDEAGASRPCSRLGAHIAPGNAPPSMRRFCPVI